MGSGSIWKGVLVTRAIDMISLPPYYTCVVRQANVCVLLVVQLVIVTVLPVALATTVCVTVLTVVIVTVPCCPCTVVVVYVMLVPAVVNL